MKNKIELIRQRARNILEESKKYSPPAGTIAIGSEYVRLEGISDSLFLFCIRIESGNSVKESGDLARERARLWASNLKKNRPNDYQVHIWEGYADVYIEWAERIINEKM